jgi:hypothetical protein
MDYLIYNQSEIIQCDKKSYKVVENTISEIALCNLINCHLSVLTFA